MHLEPRKEHAAAKTALDKDEAQVPAEFKEGGYGWVVIVATAFLNAHTWGLNSTFAVFLAYYLRNDSLGGASPIGDAFVGGLSISMAFVISPIATYFAGAQWFGTRKTIFLGGLFITIGFVGASFATQLWQLLLSQGIAFGLGMGFCFIASFPVSPQWFKKRRSLASACAAAGSGFGGLTYSLASNAMIEKIGLPWTFRVLAIISFVVITVCSYLIRDRNKAVGSVVVAFDWKLFKRAPYVLFEAWMFFSMVGYVVLVFSIADYAQNVGLTASQSALVGALFNLGQGLGRPLVGLSSDRFGRINVASFCSLLCSLFCLLFWILGTRTLASCVVFALLCGSVAGTMWAASAPVAAEVVGLPLIPSALSMSWLVLTLPATFSEVIGLSLRESDYWAYLDVQLLVGFMYLAAFVSVWILRAWKVRELETSELDVRQRREALCNDAAVPHVEEGPSTRSSSRLLENLQSLWSIQRV